MTRRRHPHRAHQRWSLQSRARRCRRILPRLLCFTRCRLRRYHLCATVRTGCLCRRQLRRHKDRPLTGATGERALLSRHVVVSLGEEKGSGTRCDRTATGDSTDYLKKSPAICQTIAPRPKALHRALPGSAHSPRVFLPICAPTQAACSQPSRARSRPFSASRRRPCCRHQPPPARSSRD